MKVSTLRSVKNLEMANLNFSFPERIDIFLGTYVLEDVMKERNFKDKGLHMRNSSFWWIVSGNVEQGKESNMVHVNKVNIAQYWELKNVPEEKHLTKSEREGVEHFNRTTKRNGDANISSLRCHWNLVDLHCDRAGLRNAPSSYSWEKIK